VLPRAELWTNTPGDNVSVPFSTFPPTNFVPNVHLTQPDYYIAASVADDIDKITGITITLQTVSNFGRFFFPPVSLNLFHAIKLILPDLIS